MDPTRMSIHRFAMLLLLCAAGVVLWGLHAEAWDLGRRSPVLNYDTAQYAIAAREMAKTGRIATHFALPIELERHATPPWPLAVVQPGLLSLEAVIFRLAPQVLTVGGHEFARWQRPDQREWLVIVIPFACFLLIGTLLGFGTARLIERHSPLLPIGVSTAAGAVVGFMFLLDPEAQHFAMSAFTELPFTYGLLGATLMLASGLAPRHPFAFGLLMGITGSFRANMLWLAPLYALAAAWCAEPGKRRGVAALALVGYALPLAPWWFYKWRAFGDPGWDLSRFVVWDGVEGRSWFSLYHLPEMPALPQGLEAARLLAVKVAGNLPGLVLSVLTGPRALWLGALALWCAIARPPRPLLAAGLVVLAGFILGILTAAVSIPWLRFVFPSRVLLEAAGVLATWALLARLAALGGATLAPVLRVAVVLLVMAWGTWQTLAGNREAEAASRERGVPSALTLYRLAVLMSQEIPPGEPVMSNLGPTLAWHARRPILHLALTPEDVEACRRKLPFNHVVLVFRDPSKAWRGWEDIMARPLEVLSRPELNVSHVRRFDSSEGFIVVWLNLGPMEPTFAGVPATPPAAEVSH
jgi:hypothetical protein